MSAKTKLTPAHAAAIRNEAALAQNRVEWAIWGAIPVGYDYMTIAKALTNVLAAVIRWEDEANQDDITAAGREVLAASEEGGE